MVHAKDLDSEQINIHLDGFSLAAVEVFVQRLYCSTDEVENEEVFEDEFIDLVKSLKAEEGFKSSRSKKVKTETASSPEKAEPVKYLKIGNQLHRIVAGDALPKILNNSQDGSTLQAMSKGMSTSRSGQTQTATFPKPQKKLQESKKSMTTEDMEAKMDARADELEKDLAQIESCIQAKRGGTEKHTNKRKVSDIDALYAEAVQNDFDFAAYDCRNKAWEMAKKYKKHGSKKAAEAKEGDQDPLKKPMGPFFMFCQDERPKVVAQFPELKVTQVGHELGRRWSEVDPSVKESYQEKARKANEEYCKKVVSNQKLSERTSDGLASAAMKKKHKALMEKVSKEVENSTSASTKMQYSFYPKSCSVYSKVCQANMPIILDKRALDRMGPKFSMEQVKKATNSIFILSFFFVLETSNIYGCKRPFGQLRVSRLE